MVGHPLGHHDHVVILISESRGARQQRHLSGLRELGERRGHPFVRPPVVDGLASPQKLAAHLGLLVGDDHPGAGARRRLRRGEARGPGPDDQHVAMGIAALVAVGVRLEGRAAEAGGAADDVLVSEPELLRPHEGFVVEAGRQEPPEIVVHAHHIEADARPGVDAGGPQAVVELDLGRAQVRLGARPGFQLNERVGLLGAGREDASRPVVLEAAPDQHDAVGQERRGQRIAGETRIGAAVEGEPERTGAVDPATFASAHRLRAHAPSPSPASGGAAPIL